MQSYFLLWMANSIFSFLFHDAWYISNMTIFHSPKKKKKKKKRTNFRFQLWLLSSRQKWLNLMTYKKEFRIQWLLRPGKWGTFWIGIFLFSKGKLDYRKWNVILWPNSRRWLLHMEKHNIICCVSTLCHLDSYRVDICTTNRKIIRLILFFRIIKSRL